MRNYRVEGIVIRRRNVGEADRIVTLFTKDSGKIQVKALGVRKLTSRRAAHIELLNHVVLTVHKARALPIVTEAQTVHAFSDIKKTLRSVGMGYHICELIDGLCPENQENTGVFSLLQNALKDLTRENINETVDQFEKELLMLLGFLPRKHYVNVNTQYLIEQLLERRLRSRRYFHRA